MRALSNEIWLSQVGAEVILLNCRKRQFVP